MPTGAFGGADAQAPGARAISFHTFQLVSFGCKVNQVEGQALAERLEEMDLRREEDSCPGRPADLMVVNTCAVTAEASRRCRQRIRRALQSGARVVVTGCYAHPAALDDSLRRIAGGPESRVVAASCFSSRTSGVSQRACARHGRTFRFRRVGANGLAEGLSERYVHVRIRGPLPEKGGRRTMVSVNLCRVNGGFLDGVRTWAR
ncbi:MAG: hypothetical protein WBD05_00110 [Phycisphaerae bacterium]